MDAVAAVTTQSTPRALIEVFDTHRRLLDRHRLTTAGDRCVIGRALDCDIVLDDPFAAPTHTSLTLQADGTVEVRDLGSRNATRIDGQRVVTGTTASITDAELIIGRTRVRVRTARTPLAPERVFRRDLLQRQRTLLAVIGLVPTVAFAVFTQWLAASEPLGPRMFLATIIAIGAIAIWVGLWGVISRVSQGAWNLRMHTAIAANAMAWCAWLAWSLDVAAFALQWHWLPWLAAFLIALAVSGALYLHLRKATHFTRRTAAIGTIALPLALAGATAWIAYRELDDVARIIGGGTLYPPQLRFASSIELDDYLTQLRTLKREASRERQQSLAARPLAAE